MMRGLIYSFCILCMYVYIYAPPFKVIPFGTDKFILLLSVFYISKRKEWRSLFDFFKVEYLFLLLMAIYSVDRGFFSGEFIYGKYDILLFLEVITVPYALYLLMDIKLKFQCDIIIINCAAIASLISLYLIVNPETAYYFKSELLKYPETLVDTFIYRGYGLSDGLTFAYPVVQGFCLGMIILSLIKNRVYLFFVIPLLVSVFTNARSGLVPAFVSLIIFFIVNPKLFTKTCIVVILISFVSFGYVTLALENNEMLKTSVEWGMTSFDILGDLFNGEKSENVDVLLNDMLVFPDTFWSWIVGSGEFLFGKVERSTDIGYLLRLNFGGIIYSMIYLLMLLYMFKRQICANKILALLMFISLIYCHFKGDFFVVNPGSRFFFLIYAFSVLNTNFLKYNRIKNI